MILDKLSSAKNYYALHPLFEEAFNFIFDAIKLPFEANRITICEKKLIAIVESGLGKGKEGAKLESHRKYIDIQYTFAGEEIIGWSSIDDCKNISQRYNEEKDIQFYSDLSSNWLKIPEGSFAIFFPEDGHAPMASQQTVHKIIMKIAVEIRQ